ncbi:MAG: LamG-like jellyroll fold domain-containing protein [Bacteroidia bacterium]
MKKLLLFALTAYSLTMSAQIPTNGLIGWFPFNGNPNDAMGYGNNGIPTNATLVPDRFGNPNSAYQFNGVDSKLLAPISNNILQIDQTASDYSVAIWVKTADPNIGGTSARVIEHKSAVSLAYPFSFQANNANNDLSCLAYDGTNVNSANIGSTVFDNNWHLVTMVVSQSLDSMFVYKDTILTQAIPITLTQSAPLSDTLTIGNSFAGTRPYAGLLDDIRVYNRVLSHQEVSILYNEGLCFQTITVTDTLIINANLTSFFPPIYQNSIKIYPNPTNDQITINFGSNFSTMTGYTLSIYNSLGQVVYSTPINQAQTTVNLSSWTGYGIYFVHLIDSQSHVIDIRKIVLQ